MTTTTFKQIFMEPGRYEVDGLPFDLSADSLKKYVENTREMMEAGGLAIPVLYRHAEESEEWGTPQAEQLPEEDARNIAGWVRNLATDANGAAVWEYEVSDPETAEKIANKSIQHVSPEFQAEYSAEGNKLQPRDFIDGKGRNWGPIIRHFALTAKPRNPDQGPMIAAPFSIKSIKVVRFSLENYRGQKMKDEHAKMAESMGDEEREKFEAMSDEERDEYAASMAEEPSVDVSGLVAQAVEATGIVIPEGTDPTSPSGLQLLLTALLNKLPAVAPVDDVEMMEEEEPAEAVGVPFSESKLKTMSATERALAEQINSLKSENVRFSEERGKEAFTLQRERALAEIQVSNGFPPGLVKELERKIKAVQFSEGKRGFETILAGARMFSKYIPKNLQFSESAAQEVDNPADEGGEGISSLEQARQFNSQFEKKKPATANA